MTYTALPTWYLRCCIRFDYMICSTALQYGAWRVMTAYDVTIWMISAACCYVSIAHCTFMGRLWGKSNSSSLHLHLAIHPAYHIKLIYTAMSILCLYFLRGSS
jgi:hypothetical protein